MSGLAASAWLAALLLALPVAAQAAQPMPPSATQGIAIGGSVTNSKIVNTVNQVDPAMLALLEKLEHDKDISEDKRREAEVTKEALAIKLGFTSAAVEAFFKIMGENVPEAKIPARLIEIATHFAETRDSLAALQPEDPHAADLVRQANDAFKSAT